MTCRRLNGERGSRRSLTLGEGADNYIDSKDVQKKAKVNFGLTGALAKDEKTGNLRNGVVLKFSEALDASIPDRKWRLYVFDGDDLKEILHIHREASFLIGKDIRVADIVIDHDSISKQHALITFRNVEVSDSSAAEEFRDRT